MATGSAARQRNGLYGHEEDRHDDDQAGERPDLADPLDERFELGAERLAGGEVTLGELFRVAHLRAEEAVLEAEQGDDREEADEKNSMGPPALPLVSQARSRRQDQDHRRSDQARVRPAGSRRSPQSRPSGISADREEIP